MALALICSSAAMAVTVTFTASGNWVAPVGVTSVTVEAWGGGGGGGAATGNPAKGGGGAGGQYASKVVTVIPGNTYAIVVGAGGTVGAAVAGGVGGSSTFAATTVVANGGAGGGLAAVANGVGGLGAITGGVGDVVFAGGNGSNGAGATGVGGAGGGGAGSGGAGGNAVGNTAGAGTAIGGGNGGAGLLARAAGNPGVVAGGGGGGGYATNATDRSGGVGAAGKVTISYVGVASITYYHDTTAGVNIGFDGTTNVTAGVNQIIPPIITASLVTTNTCVSSARSVNHPTGLYTHSRWYLNTNYAVATDISANPTGSARIRGQAITDTVIVRLYDYNPVTGAKVLIGSSPVITLTGGGTTTAYPYTISSALYTVPAGNRLMLQYDFNQPVATNVARVYCSATLAYITVTESPGTVAPHHIQIDHDGLGQTCRAESLTVKACADAACLTNFTAANVTGNVTWAGAPGGTIAFTITGGGTGQTTVLLPVTAAQTVTLGTSSVAPVPTNVSTCTNASGGAACNIIFSAASACFDAVEVGAVSTPLFTKLSGTAFSLDVTAATAYSGTLQVELVNSSSGTCLTYASLNPPNTQSTTFTSQTSKTLNFTYANAAKDVKVRITGLAASSCSSGRFAIRPQSLTVTSSANADATGTNASAVPVVKAGVAFTLNADTAIAGYDGTPAVDNAKLLAHATAVAPGTISGVFAAANPVTGVATGSSFTYSEVGYFKADVDGVYDDTFTAVDSAAGDCTNDFSNTLDASGKYGCKFGNTSASSYFGRFIPDHFVITTNPISPVITQADFLPQTITTVNAPALAGDSTISIASTTGFKAGSKVRIPGAGAGGNAFVATVTAVGASTLTLSAGIGTALVGGGTENVIAEWGSYMGEEMLAQFTLQAVSLTGSLTLNYQGTYAKLNPAAAGNPLRFGAVNAGVDLTARLDISLLPGAGTTSFNSGSATVAATLAITRGASPDGPYNALKLGIAPTTAEADGVLMGTYDLNVGGTNDHTNIMDPLVQDVTEVRYGRMKISNAHGSELLPLPISLTAQYWNGASYVTNTNDNDTTLAIADIVLSNYQRKTGDTWTTSPALANGTAAQGGWIVNLSKPTATFTGKGSVDLTTNAPGYLPSNTSRATFGVYKGANEFIYLRENY